jgi:hypothetical protein
MTMPRDLDYLDLLRTRRSRTSVRCPCGTWFDYLPGPTYKQPPTHCRECFGLWRARRAAREQRRERDRKS